MPDTLSAIGITAADPHRGRGIPGKMPTAPRENARTRGFGEVVAPVPPHAEHREPLAPMDEYAFRTRQADGLPHGPRLRVHVRAGGTAEAVARPP